MNDRYIVLLNKNYFQIEYILMKIVQLLFVYNQEYKHQIEIQMFDESNQRQNKRFWYDFGFFEIKPHSIEMFEMILT